MDKKKLVIIAIALTALLVPVLASTVLAGDGSMPAAGAAAVSDSVSVTGGAWQKIGALDLAIKTGTPKDLIISVSLESSLFTTNRLKGDEGSTSMAAVEVEVRVNGEPVMVSAADSAIVFNRRLVELTGDLKHYNPGDPPSLDPNLLDHWIELFMETKSANSFNFIARDVRESSDTNYSTIEVWVMATPLVDDVDGKVGAVLGNASVVVNEVNLKDS